MELLKNCLVERAIRNAVPHTAGRAVRDTFETGSMQSIIKSLHDHPGVVLEQRSDAGFEVLDPDKMEKKNTVFITLRMDVLDSEFIKIVCAVGLSATVTGIIERIEFDGAIKDMDLGGIE